MKERNKELEKNMEDYAGHYGKMGEMDSDGDYDNSSESKDDKKEMDYD